MLRFVFAAALAGFATGCASAPRPSPDLVAFALERGAPDAEEIAADEPDLARKADLAHTRALEAHARGDEATRIEQVYLADIYWRTAAAGHEALAIDNSRTVAESALRDARAQLVEVRAEIARLQGVERQRASRLAQGPAVSSSSGVISNQDGTSTVPEPVPVAPTASIDAGAEADHREALVAGLSALGEAGETQSGAWVALEDAVAFDADGVARLDPVYAEPLAALAAAWPALRISIDAYVTPSRDPSRVLMESQAIALAVREALVERGIDGARLRNMGRGAGAPGGDLPSARVEVRFEAR